ncbi:hypothetical protein ACIPWE_18685 [Streptomyces sp. NPDC090073]|uniref:hypothetical protein n=1 Tax=Streptomyces sp. NPDC090073 TaxID=3365936 RepID=UPI00380C29D4
MSAAAPKPRRVAVPSVPAGAPVLLPSEDHEPPLFPRAFAATTAERAHLAAV